MPCDGMEGLSDAPPEATAASSSPKCRGCSRPVQDHVGPHGKDRCVWSLVDSLRLRLEQLEKTVTLNQERHAEEIA